MKNTGKDYESLVEQVFIQLMEQDLVRNIVVEKNKILQGRSTTHEIDVYWEFIIGRINYSTIIQAKDWEYRVPQGEMLKLKAILDDLPGQPRGIFVTKTGYQSGALDVARATGIIAYELRKPTEDDWEGKARTIILNFKAFIPSTKVEVISDNEWIQRELRRLDIKEINISIAGMEDQLFIKNEDGTIWKTIHDLKESEHQATGMEEVHNKEVLIEMNQPRFMDTGDINFPRIKIKAVKLILSKGLYEHTLEIDGTTMVGFILRNLIDGSEVVLDKKAKIRA